MVLLYEGFSFGFQSLSFSGSSCVVVSNLPSVKIKPAIVLNKILKEIAEGRISGPFPSPAFENFRISPLGGIPKKEPNTYLPVDSSPILSR